ncbi:MAG: hypothetical protein AAFX40_12205 [Cyanobacteria bacterium J06639_1]
MESALSSRLWLRAGAFGTVPSRTGDLEASDLETAIASACEPLIPLMR